MNTYQIVLHDGKMKMLTEKWPKLDFSSEFEKATAHCLATAIDLDEEASRAVMSALGFSDVSDTSIMIENQPNTVTLDGALVKKETYVKGFLAYPVHGEIVTFVPHQEENTDEVDDEGLTYCPNCGRSYDDADADFYICHHCGHSAKEANYKAILLELVCRANLAMPETEQETKWFDSGLDIENSDFLCRLYEALEIGQPIDVPYSKMKLEAIAKSKLTSRNRFFRKSFPVEQPAESQTDKNGMKLWLRLLKYSDRYCINFQMWPEQYTIYIEKDGVELGNFVSGCDTAIESMRFAVEYLDRITRKSKP